MSLIPTTQQDTTLLHKRVGDFINLETDIIGKYVRQLMGAQSLYSGEDAPKPGASRLSEAFLLEHGFGL